MTSNQVAVLWYVCAHCGHDFVGEVKDVAVGTSQQGLELLATVWFSPVAVKLHTCATLTAGPERLTLGRATPSHLVLMRPDDAPAVGYSPERFVPMQG